MALMQGEGGQTVRLKQPRIDENLNPIFGQAGAPNPGLGESEGFTFQGGASGGPADNGPDYSAGYGPGENPNGPSPEAMLSGGGMPSYQGGGGMHAPSMPNHPSPVSMGLPVPNPLPSPSPRALSGALFGKAGGLLGGGLGVPGQSEHGKPQSSDLLGLLASLLGRR